MEERIGKIRRGKSALFRTSPFFSIFDRPFNFGRAGLVGKGGNLALNVGEFVLDFDILLIGLVNFMSIYCVHLHSAGLDG